MSKVKKTLSESGTYKYDEDTTYGYNRPITTIEKRRPNESQEKKGQDVVGNYYRRAYSEWG